MIEGRLEKILRGLRRTVVVAMLPLVASCGNFWEDDDYSDDYYYEDDYVVVEPVESYSLKYSGFDDKVLLLDDNHTLAYNFFVPFESFNVIRDVSERVFVEVIDEWDDSVGAYFKYRISGGPWTFMEMRGNRGIIDFGLEDLIGENVDIAAFVDEYDRDEDIVVNYFYVDKNDAPEYEIYGDFDGYTYFDILYGQNPKIRLPKIRDPEGDDKSFYVFVDGYFVDRIDDGYYYTPRGLGYGIYDFTVVPVDEYGEEGFESYPCRVYVR